MVIYDSCDYQARLDDMNKEGPRYYGKSVLHSDEPYKLWDRKYDTFDLDRIEYLYTLFIHNMMNARKCFPASWVDPDEILYTTKGLIWDWTTMDERQTVMDSIMRYGCYFPIFVLPRGILHNQIGSPEELERLEKLNKYNTYNGNHRIDALQELKHLGKRTKAVLIYEIPPICQKSCTGFNYSIINHRFENELTSHKLDKPIRLYHLAYLEDEMKMYYLDTLTKNVDYHDGVNLVNVDNYNTAFRILTEFQNALEPPLTRYYELYRTLPDGVKELARGFNDLSVYNEIKYYIGEGALER